MEVLFQRNPDEIIPLEHNLCSLHDCDRIVHAYKKTVRVPFQSVSKSRTSVVCNPYTVSLVILQTNSTNESMLNVLVKGFPDYKLSINALVYLNFTFKLKVSPYSVN